MALREYGSPSRFTVYPDAAHDAWTQAYNNPELYDWLLAQKRKTLPAHPPAKITPAAPPITLKLTDFNSRTPTVVDLLGQPGKGVLFAKDSASASSLPSRTPAATRSRFTSAPDDAHNVSHLSSTARPTKLILYKSGVVAPVQCPDRVLIYQPGDYTLRFVYPGSPAASSSTASS